MQALTREQTRLEGWRALLDAAVAVLLALGLVSLSYGAWKIWQPALPVPQAPTVSSITPAGNAHLSLPASEPSHIDIPAIGVHSALVYIGLNVDGSPGVPSGEYVDDASWLTTTVTPGEMGTSVIIGHVDTAKSGPSVFYNLGKLVPGSKISILREDHRAAVFTVNTVQIYNKDAFPSTLVYGKSVSAALRLITCTGSWDAAAHRYTQNLVVFASLTDVH